MSTYTVMDAFIGVNVYCASKFHLLWEFFWGGGGGFPW